MDPMKVTCTPFLSCNVPHRVYIITQPQKKLLSAPEHHAGGLPAKGTLSFWPQQLRKGKSGAAPPTSSKPGCWEAGRTERTF